jgi:hypothetical protein
VYSIAANKYLRNSHPKIAQLIKRGMVYPRYYLCLHRGREMKKQYKDVYSQQILYIAGLPKSGTTWLENLLSSYPGITPIMPYQLTSHEMKFKGSCDYDFPVALFQPLKKGLFLLKLHCHGSQHNVRILSENKIRYCILYRDLRDIAVSYFFYVSRTPWHPEHEVYRALDVKAGLMKFCLTRLDEYTGWINSWRENRNPNDSIEITFEKMLENPITTFKEVVRLFELHDSDMAIKQRIKNNEFSRKKQQPTGESGFFRKGISGDWKNYFDDEIKTVFKQKSGELLITLGYEQNLDW